MKDPITKTMRFSYSHLKNKGMNPLHYLKFINKHCNELNAHAEIRGEFLEVHPLPY